MNNNNNKETRREQIIYTLMTYAAMSRSEAEFAAAVELGEIRADIVARDKPEASGRPIDD